ncbi:arginine N-succinyltransferase [Pelomonas sp. SE-A7]|uniref:arginine N-succinyltransferase n=1 Tax=Pelomonas sp. SE-A7 TaxID=3054953 RepID=UPI00259C6E5F|nr:arginine N-succinyltransferase [Pelomonas sp. SE-A7]MDM4765686.1 arginine N-succinyltransferase [Pelomonas sp. SE-A7]
MSSNCLIRAAGEADLPTLLGWTAQDGWPVDTTLQREGEQLWVAVDAEGRLRGCLRLRERLGLVLPRYSYHVGQAVHAAAELQLFHRQATLLLGNDQTGCSEICSLAGDETALPALLAHALGQLSPGARVVVELQGQRDARGSSPFWRSLGAHFCPRDPAEARASLGEAWLSHLAALLPRQLLYVSFLEADAQAALGRHDASLEAVARLLNAAGFAPGQHVRIDDGGPIWERLAG